MQRLHRVLVLVSVLALLSSYRPSCAKDNRNEVKAVLRTEGSIPPAGTLYSCVHELNKQPLSEVKIESCIRELSLNSFIKKVEIHKNEMEDGRVLVEFLLRGDSLAINELKIDTFDEQEGNLLKILSTNTAYLQIGGTYTWRAETSTCQAIRQFYLAKGKLVGITPEVHLDYKQHSADVKFKVLSGPTIPPQPSGPLFGQNCDDRVTSIDWSRTDDAVPIKLIESNLAVGYLNSCFSDELAQRDKSYLSNSSILTSSLVGYSGSFGSRHIKFALKGKPLRIEQINLRGYGNASANLETDSPGLRDDLNLKIGESYSRSAARKSVGFLNKAFSKDGYWTEVTEHEDLSGETGVLVTFSVLVFPLQTVIVDGREIK